MAIRFLMILQRRLALVKDADSGRIAFAIGVRPSPCAMLVERSMAIVPLEAYLDAVCPVRSNQDAGGLRVDVAEE